MRIPALVDPVLYTALILNTQNTHEIQGPRNHNETGKLTCAIQMSPESGTGTLCHYDVL